MTDLLPQFNRISFLTLNRNRLFTAEQVCEIVEYYCEREREKVLDKVIQEINQAAPEMEGKKLFITVLSLCRRIDKLRQGDRT